MSKGDKLSYGDFKPLSESHVGECGGIGLDAGLPQLVLARDLGDHPTKHVRRAEVEFEDPSGREWHLIQHQTAGLGCHQHYLIGTFLRPTKDTLLRMISLSSHYLDSNLGAGGAPSLSELNEYNATIQADFNGIGCESTYSYLEEAIYPIDYDHKLVNEMIEDELPEDLVNNFVFASNNEEDGSRFMQGMYRIWYLSMSLFVLGENCD